MSEPISAPWGEPGWLERATAWAEAELGRHGLALSAPFEQIYQRPWSTVLRAPTSSGDVYLKATLPALRHEVALTAALHRWHPKRTLPVLAADVERGWLLLPDGGPRLREVIRAARDERLWDGVLAGYAELQMALAGRVDELLALGVPDVRLAALPDLYESLLEDAGSLRVGQERGLTPEQHARLRGLVPRVRALCEQLAGYGLPETLHHGDLTDGNVFLRDGRPRFFDWGDSVVSHPFYSLRTSFVSLYFSLDIDDGDQRQDALRDVYLAAWERYAPRERLLEAYALARPLASLSGALGWRRSLATVPEAARAENAHAVPGLLQEFLELV